MTTDAKGLQTQTTSVTEVEGLIKFTILSTVVDLIGQLSNPPGPLKELLGLTSIF